MAEIMLLISQLYINHENYILLFLLIVSGLILVYFIYSRNFSEFSCLEEPFSSMSPPIKNIDVAVFHDSGDLIEGGRAVAVKFVDANDKVAYLVAIKRPNVKSYKSIVVNPPIQWGWDSRIGLVADISIPSDLYNPPKSYNSIKDVRSGMKDIMHILEKYGDSNKLEIKVALKALAD